jgi:CDP-diacylglycerol--glycerol-3-phosphate 3-phosphatidyltransferase/cardiolipin synthase
LNLPNRLTLARIAAIPLILFFMLPVPSAASFFDPWNLFIDRYGMAVALLLFVAASITDYLDGRIARKLGIVTNIGKLMDPIADKLLVVSVLIAFTQLGRVHAGVVVLILAREFLVTGLRVLAIEKGTVLAADATGKVKTVTQMTAIILLLLHLFLVGISPLLAGVSFFGSFVEIVRIVADIAVASCVIATIYSGIHYFRTGIPFLRD